MTGFADDLTYTKAIYVWDELAEVEMDLALIANWLGSKLLRLNLDKVKSMLISRKRNQHALNRSLNGHCIEQVNSFKLLGVTISKDLSWCTHIQQVCTRSKNFWASYTVFSELSSHTYWPNSTSPWSSLRWTTAPRFGTRSTKSTKLHSKEHNPLLREL